MSRTIAARPFSISLARSVLIAVAGSLCLALSAKVAVPLRPVPITMQSLAVVMLGAALGPRLAMAAVVAYLAEGACGIPVFAGPVAGLPVLFGVTGGYLFGYVPAAGAVGWLTAHGWGRKWRLAASLAIGHAILFATGLLVLAEAFGWQKAVAVGLTPFLLGTAVKIALGTALVEAAPARSRA